MAEYLEAVVCEDERAELQHLSQFLAVNNHCLVKNATESLE